MTRKAKTKKKSVAKSKQKPLTKPDAGNDAPYGEAGEYGGLPDRDLKKNLGGCG
jgi:hypothetical protein